MPHVSRASQRRLVLFAAMLLLAFCLNLLSLGGALRVGRGEEDPPRLVLRLLWGLWGLLAAGFMTNDLHHWVFRAAYENGVISLDMSRKYISVLTDSGLYIYDSDDYDLTANYEVSACLKVLMYDDGAAAAASRNSAGVYSAKGNEADKGKGK